ncbi:MAG: NADH-ubiquinone oxidoreductase-F iron-sulfur binding region domain-containing protein [Nitrospirota bacterium]
MNELKDMEEQRILLHKDIPIDEYHSLTPIPLEEYISGGGYRALAKALKELKPEDIIEEVKKSGLRGRGGAGFPTGQKWELVANAESEEKHLCCNAAEGEQVTFKDRCLIRSNPHQLIEGIIIASYAVGSNKSYLYVNGGLPEEISVLEKTLHEARDNGYIGENILGTNFSLDISIHRCPNRYVAGEETAMLEVIEGREAKPWQKPPYYPATRGLHGKPTLINNAETLSNIPHIILKGGEWFSRIGSPESPGTMLFTLTGDVNRPGIYESPLGTTLKELINNCGQGLKDGMEFKAAFIPGSHPITGSHLEVPLDFKSLKEAGSGLGSGALIIFGNGACVIEKTLGFSRFYMEESCGQCPPCQMGTSNMAILLQKFEDGQAVINDLASIEKICIDSKGKGYCRLLTGASLVVEGAISHFKKEFEDHIHERKCPSVK